MRDLAKRPLPFSRRQAFTVIGALLAAAGVRLFLSTHPGRHVRDSAAMRLWIPTPFDAEGWIARARAAADAIRPLFERKREPRALDWLALVEEPGQTFNKYVREFTPATREAQGEVLLLPLGEFDTRLSALVANAAELVSAFYGRAVRLLPAEPVPPLPASARRLEGGTEQLFTGPLLEYLRQRVPANAVALLALTPRDLTPGGDWSFVFGQASLTDRVGIWSLYRLTHPRTPAELQLRRVAGTALHELGHMFGIWHCTAYECCMNGSMSVRESDQTPLAFCPECDAKLGWRLRLEPQPRYARLAELAAARGLQRDAGLWSACARALTPAAPA
jgi:archaemetzincin